MNEKKRIGVGFVGAGLIAWRHVNILLHQRGVKLIGVADIIKEKAEKMANVFNIKAHTDFRKLLEEPELDAVWLSIPPSERGKVTLEIVKAGKHVMAEKPIGWSLEETDKIARAVKEMDIRFMIGYCKRFAPRFRIPKKILKEGAFGEPIWSLAHYNIVPRDLPLGSWYGDIKKCGGLVVENTIHYIDLIKWFVGSPITKVYANLAKLLPRKTTVEDSGAIILHLKKPMVVTITCGSNAPENFPDEEFKLVGTKGAFENSAQVKGKIKVSELKVYANKVPYIQHWYFSDREGFEEEDVYFLNCIRNGKEPIPSVEDARDSLEVALASMLSTKTGEVVQLPLKEPISVPDLFPLPWGP